MNNLSLKLLYLFFLLPNFLFGQYDYDSLLKNSEDFRKKIEAIDHDHELFGFDSLLSITIKSDFKNLIKKKFKKEYQTARFIVDVNDTVQITREVKIKSRGNYRLRSCYFPPLTVNFKKKDAIFKSLEEFDKVKLVNNCRMQETYQKYIISEYLIYKMYNLISPFSFRVRLVRMKYVDMGRGNKIDASYAFFIESEEELMDRLGGVIIDKKGISAHGLQRWNENKMALFQYMIGNTDYSVSALHNIKLFKPSDPTEMDPYAIPYDFDYSGLVNTSYSIPKEELPIKKVTDRFFMGACQSDEVFQKTIEDFLNLREQFQNLVESEKLLDEDYRRQIMAFLDEFYVEITNEHLVKRKLLDNCQR